MTGWSVLLAAHASGATLAVMLGGYNVLRRRKGDLLHRRLGRIWFVDMYWVAFSSFGIKELHPGHFSWIHGLSAWTIFSLSVALWAAATHRIEAHKQWIVGSYLGLVGAGLAAVAFPQRQIPQTAVHAPLTLLVALAALTALAWLVVRLAAIADLRVNAVSGARHAVFARNNPKINRVPSAGELAARVAEPALTGGQVGALTREPAAQ